MSKDAVPVAVVVRLSHRYIEGPPGIDIKVVQVVPTLEEATQQAARLNREERGGGGSVVYFPQVSQYYAGSRASSAAELTEEEINEARRLGGLWVREDPW